MIVRHLSNYNSYDDSDLRDAFVRYREARLNETYPDVPRGKCLLRRRMIDALLRFKPINADELTAMLPGDLLEQTDSLQLASAADEVAGHCQTKNLAIFQSPSGCWKSQVFCAVHRQPGITIST